MRRYLPDPVTTLKPRGGEPHAADTATPPRINLYVAAVVLAVAAVALAVTGLAMNNVGVEFGAFAVNGAAWLVRDAARTELLAAAEQGQPQ